MYLEYCSVFMRGTFCLLRYEPRVKLLNNGNVAGLSFGFRAVPTSDHRVAGSNPAWGEILPEHRQHFIAQSLSCSPFHRPDMTEILLKGTLNPELIHPSDLATHFFQSAETKSIVCTCLKRTWQLICSILFVSNILLNKRTSTSVRMLIENYIFWVYFICTNFVKRFNIQKPLVSTKKGETCFRSPEPKAQWWAYRIGMPLSSVCMYVCMLSTFSTSSPHKPLGQSKSNFIWSIYGMGQRKFVQLVQVLWPRWPIWP